MEEVRRVRRVRKKRKKRLGRYLVLAGAIFIVFVMVKTVFSDVRYAMLYGDDLASEEAVWKRSEWKESDFLTDDYPASLKKLYESNPETKKFVKDYFKEKDIEHDMDISRELSKDRIPLFLQWDKRWGYEEYGGDFLAVTGCGPTCLSMVICGLKGDSSANPYAIAKWAEDNGYYVKGEGSAWSLMTDGAACFGLNAYEISFDLESIRSELSLEHPIICAMGPGDFTTEGHFIVLTGITDEGYVTVHDPNSKERSKRTWSLDELMPQIRNLWVYSSD